ncbi:hypothetical protein D5086_029526 [Populus alba]|uniref:Uncharacterized protein n=1 Tax=Populus alba TaxID=43335 RepID=A0ACC4ATY6_POPAL
MWDPATFTVRNLHTIAWPGCGSSVMHGFIQNDFGETAETWYVVILPRGEMGLGRPCWALYGGGMAEITSCIRGVHSISGAVREKVSLGLVQRTDGISILGVGPSIFAISLLFCLMSSQIFFAIPKSLNYAYLIEALLGLLFLRPSDLAIMLHSSLLCGRSSGLLHLHNISFGSCEETNAIGRSWWSSSLSTHPRLFWNICPYNPYLKGFPEACIEGFCPSTTRWFPVLDCVQ